MGRKNKGAPAEWVRLYGHSRCRWGVRIEKGMRMKDLPPDLAMTAEPHEGALEPIRFRGGTFYFVTWKQTNPLYWPEPTETEVRPGDYLAEAPDGGVCLIRSSRN